jgi:hypothetical protein
MGKAISCPIFDMEIKCTIMTNRFKLWLLVGFQLCCCALNAQVVINEFLTVNDTILQDEDLDFSDWIELKNTSSNVVDLTGWFLTDDAVDLNKWQFPATSLAPGGYLVVFASNKDRAIAGSELHTNFKLSSDGEYLALIQPDGTTVASEFAPAFLPQVEDISYGSGGGITDIFLIADRAACSAWVPTSASDGTNWQLSEFDDSSWIAGNLGVGYDTGIRYDPLYELDLLDEMRNKNNTAYIRIPFSFSNLSDILKLTLRMKYDDGFVAYINGIKVASGNAPDTVDWQAKALGDHSDNLSENHVEFDITAYRNALISGQNILAVHALNNRLDSSDMLIVPELNCYVESDDASVTTEYLEEPTPGTENSAKTLLFSAPVQISEHGSLRTAPVLVSLSAMKSVEKIYYTLDGTEPTAESNIYSAPIQISSTTMLRARSFQSELLLGPIRTETYLFVDNSVKNFSSNLPIVVLDNLGVSSTLPTTRNELKQAAFLAIFEPASDGRTSLTYNFTVGTRAGLARRGQSSLRPTEDKPSLSVETWSESEDEDADISPLGLSAESDWVLWAPWSFDRAGIRNALIYEFTAIP